MCQSVFTRPACADRINEPFGEESKDWIPTQSYPAQGALLSVRSSHQPWDGLFPLWISPIPNSVPIRPERRCHDSRPCTIQASPILGSREEQQPLVAYVPGPASTVAQVGTNRYPADSATAVPYDYRKSTSDGSCGSVNLLPLPTIPLICPSPKQPSLSPSKSLSASPNDLVSVSPPLPADPRYQSQSTSTMEQPEMKTWCSVCNVGFSQQQVLRRHFKDKHETRNRCQFCTSFTWSRGRPYLYRNHLRVRHSSSPPLALERSAQHG